MLFGKDPAVSMPRLAVLGGVVVLFVAWIATHVSVLASGEDALIRFVLSGLFALLILFRREREPEAKPVSPRLVVIIALVGLLAALAGIVVPVRQFEWLGVLLLGLACLWWALPAALARDAARAVFLIYWAHPLPSKVFGQLQLAMQTGSVKGAEWLLHLFNTPVWADGMVLRSGAGVFDVPAWCSGMRSATTVFLLGLGIGLLRRMRWDRLAILLAVALVQALGLNVLRLAIMVSWAPAFRTGAALQFLHDTAGIVLVLSGLLLVAELWAWERLAAYRAHRAVEPDLDVAVGRRARPPFWAALYEHRWTSVATALSLAVAGWVAYQSRPGHREAMRRTTVAALRDAEQLEAAYRLGESLRRQRPDDAAWRLTVLRILIQQGEYTKALARLGEVSGADAAMAHEKKVLRAYCLMGLGQIDEAAQLVRELPQDPLNPDPRTAMILAELAHRADDPGRVAEYVLIASRWGPNLARIRKLYPYLRRHRKWDAISATDRRVTYREPAQVLCAAEAAMNLNQVPEVASLTAEALRGWPDDPRLLEPLFYMAAKRPDTTWEGEFSATLLRRLRLAGDADEVYGLFEKCFALARPDLGWQVYRRLAEMDAGHPGLALSVARYGGDWFSFRTRHLGLGGPTASDRTDLRLLLQAGGHLPPWRDLRASIPRAVDLIGGDAVAVRQQSLNTALAAFRARTRHGKLSRTMQYEYAGAMDMADDVNGATQQLARIVAAWPDEAPRVMLALTEIHERRAEWETVYETLRTWADRPDLPLALQLRWCRAQMSLHLGLAALDSSARALAAFPHSTEAMRMRAMAVREYDAPEEALFAIGRPRVRRDAEVDVIEAELLFATQRYGELVGFVEAASLPGISTVGLPPQALFLPPAEQAAMWHRVALPSEESFARTAEVLRRNLKTASSPFMRGMMRQWLAAYEAEGGGEAASIERWRACGRDAREQAAALNQLSLLLCRRGNVAGARRAAEAAVAAWPGSPLLWRILVSLSEADLATVIRARQACPADAELWLAEIVVRSRQKMEGDRPSRAFAVWVEAEIARVAAADAFSAGAVTRAGEYLARGGMTKAAAVAARDAAARSRGLLPASALAIHCALRTQDKDWALAATRQALREAIDPGPMLYKIMAELRGANASAPLDDDMVATLKRLRRSEPNNALWAEMLTYVLFHRESWSELMNCLGEARAALDAGSKKRAIFLLGAEAARQQQLIDQAAEILKKGLAAYPGDTALLNNLAYTLAQDPSTVGEAQKLIPQLAVLAEKEPQIIDTIASVWLRGGKAKEAEPWVQQLERFAKDQPRWRARACLHRAGIAVLRGDPAEAQRLCRILLADTRKVTNEDVVTANQILYEADAAALKARQLPGGR